jgi:hypothetical protein
MEYSINYKERATNMIAMWEKNKRITDEPGAVTMPAAGKIIECPSFD